MTADILMAAAYAFGFTQHVAMLWIDRESHIADGLTFLSEHFGRGQSDEEIVLQGLAIECAFSVAGAFVGWVWLVDLLQHQGGA